MSDYHEHDIFEDPGPFPSSGDFIPQFGSSRVVDLQSPEVGDPLMRPVEVAPAKRSWWRRLFGLPAKAN